MADFEALLADPDTGDDLEFDRAYIALQSAAQGKPEQQFGDTIVAAEDPDWRDVEAQALALLDRSRDIRIIAQLAVARLHTQGVVAYAAGVGLIASLLDSHWENVHPRLDPEDDNDPTMRANAVLGIGHPGRALKLLREVPLARSRRAGAFGWREIALALGLIEADPEAEPPTEAAVTAAFADSDPAWLQSVRDAVSGLGRDLKAINAAFEEKAGYGTSPDLTRLEKQVADMQRVMDRFKTLPAEDAPLIEEMPEEDDEADAPTGGGAAPAPVGAARRAGGGGFASVMALREVGSREEALHLMELACAYYEQHEPSSPLPLLIRRAQRLADKNFLDILRDLAPDGVHQAQMIAGMND
jgi:type VI secretion system protein ImpA